MRRRVDASRSAAHHGDAHVGELIGQLARHFQTVVRRLARTDQRHGILVLGREPALHVENDGRIVNVAEQLGIILVRLDENVAPEIFDPF